MKQLKLAALICLINFLFFGGFLWFQSFQQKIQKQANNLNGELSISNSNAPISPVNSNSADKNQISSKTVKGTSPLNQNSTGSQSTNPPAPVIDNRCIVIISGAKYDVTQLRQTHSGGDVFQCGTDMTQIFFSQHNQRLLDNQMAQYKIP